MKENLKKVKEKDKPLFSGKMDPVILGHLKIIKLKVLEYGNHKMEENMKENFQIKCWTVKEFLSGQYYFFNNFLNYHRINQNIRAIIKMIKSMDMVFFSGQVFLFFFLDRYFINIWSRIHRSILYRVGYGASEWDRIFLL